jgi:hypothetical protein
MLRHSSLSGASGHSAFASFANTQLPQEMQGVSSIELTAARPYYMELRRAEANSVR